MGKKGGKEKGKKKDKGSAKPDTMSDQEWALYNNVAELVMNLRGPSPLNTVAVTIDRGTAALYLWQHACSSAAKVEEIISVGGIPQVVAALKNVEPHEVPSCAGLIHQLSGFNENAREQLTNSKPVYPYPAMYIVPMLFEHLGGNSPATEVSCVGTLNNLATDPATRTLVVKEIMRDPVGLMNVMHSSVSCQARAEAADCLKKCAASRGGPSEIKAAEALRDVLVDVHCEEVCLESLKERGAECVSGRLNWTVPLIEGSAALLHRLLDRDSAKVHNRQMGGAKILAQILHPEVNIGVETPLSFVAKAAVAACIAMITTPVGFKGSLLDQLSKMKLRHSANAATQPLEGMEKEEGDTELLSESDAEEPEEEDDDDSNSEGDTGSELLASPAALKTLTPEEMEEQRKELERMVRELEAVCFEVMESGAVRALVLLTAGPEPEPGAGKKKKKAKEPPQPPGMPEAHLHSTLALRHCSLFPFTHKEMLDFGAVTKLTKLVESKVAQTRLNAQAVLLNLGVDDSTLPAMKKAEVPEYIMLMANQHFLEEIAHPQKADPSAAKEEDKEDKGGKKGKKKK